MSFDIDTPLSEEPPKKEEKPLWPIEIPADQCSDAQEKRILFGNGDRLGLFPLKHPWAWEAYNDMQANHWRPNEIPMGPDIACWKAPHTLMPEERRVFWLTFGRLTTMDLLRVDSIAMLSQITTSPEVAMALDWMNAQERLHSESYEVCIDGLGFDYDQVYNLYRHLPSIQAQVDMAQKIDADFSALLQEVRQAPVERDYLYEEAIKTSAFWFLMFEGIWFMANLSGAVQNLARQGKMTATAEQFIYIKRDETAHVKLGVDLIRALIGECPEAWNDKTKSSIRQTMLQCLSLEQDFIEEALPRPIMGYSAEGHMQYAKTLANMRCRVLGLEEVAKGATNPYPWISEQQEMKKEVNFFEGRPTDYQVGQLKWD